MLAKEAQVHRILGFGLMLVGRNSVAISALIDRQDVKSSGGTTQTQNVFVIDTPRDVRPPTPVRAEPAAA